LVVEYSKMMYREAVIKNQRIWLLRRSLFYSNLRRCWPDRSCKTALSSPVDFSPTAPEYVTLLHIHRLPSYDSKTNAQAFDGSTPLL